ncbi:hypothetical protein [Kineococcus sp. SYSU DK002]|uniref:hypothetical protein n=1 Tax=Kineococcus sp. SYSU DK002 TaxID=3383123 RepID=UPI003D7D1973
MTRTPDVHERVGPAERMAFILRLVSEPAPRVVSTHQLREKVPEYRDGTNGDRTLRRDLKELRVRGLIETGLTVAPHALNRTGLRLKASMKGVDLRLNTDEHRALALARRRLQRGPLRVGARSGRSRQFDLVLSVLRFLEEEFLLDEGSAGPNGRQLAQDFGVPPQELRAALAWFVANRTPNALEPEKSDQPVLDGFDVVDVDLDDPESDFIVVLDACPSTTAGLGALGRFAYTLEETDERLDLVDEVCRVDDAWGDGPLRTAADKLSMWRSQLTRAHARRRCFEDVAAGAVS